MYASLPLSPRKARHFPPCSGEADTKEKRIHSFYYLNTPLTISFAGFLPLPLVGYGVSLHFSVATLLKIQFACHRSPLPPLKNDGRSELRFRESTNDFLLMKGKNGKRKLSPLVGESVNRQVDERGKCEQKQKNDLFVLRISRLLPVKNKRIRLYFLARGQMTLKAEYMIK